MEMGTPCGPACHEAQKGTLEKGYHFYIDSITNQQFVIVGRSEITGVEQQFLFNHEMRYDENHMVIRICTSWATKEEIWKNCLRHFRNATGADIGEREERR